MGMYKCIMNRVAVTPRTGPKIQNNNILLKDGKICEQIMNKVMLYTDKMNELKFHANN